MTSASRPSVGGEPPAVGPRQLTAARQNVMIFPRAARLVVIVKILEDLPVAAALEAYHLAEAWRLEVSGRHDDLFALQTFHEDPSSMARQLGVHVGPRDPVRLMELHRVVGGVAQDERALALRGDRKSVV